MNFEKQLNQNPSNVDLRRILALCEINRIRKKAATILLNQKPSNRDLKQVLLWCASESLKTKAAEKLLTQNPSNDDLAHVVTCCSSRSPKTKAAEILLAQNPSMVDLTEILIGSPSESIKTKAWENLKQQVAPKSNIDEESLIKQIAELVLSNPEKLQMAHWHCGTVHCLAGWATILNKDAQKIEKKYTTKIAGCVALPSYAHLFFKTNAEVLKELKKIQTQQKP